MDVGTTIKNKYMIKILYVANHTKQLIENL